MIKTIKNIWSKIVHLGLSDIDDPQEKSRVKLLNKLAIVAFAISSSIYIFKLYINVGMVHLNLVPISIELSVLFFSYKAKHLFSRLISCFVFPIGIHGNIMGAGATLGEFIVYPLIIFLTFILLENRKTLRNIALLWTITLSILSFIYIAYGFEYNPISSDILGSILLFLGCIVLI